jgi:hypothetical protein
MADAYGGRHAEVTIMAAQHQTLHVRPDVAHREVKPIAGALAAFGMLALAAGAWGLGAPDARGRLVQGMLADPLLRLAAVLVLWAAFLTVAIYITQHWQTLRWWEMAAGWLLVAWLWAGGLAMIYATRFQFSAWLVPFLTSPVTQWAASLLSLAGGTILLGLAFALWPFPAPRERPRRRPRIIRTVRHPSPA